MPADASPLASCIYTGVVRHRRKQPFQHEFRYRLFLVCLDLHELDRVFRGRWLWSTERPAIARFRRDDFLPETGPRPLDAVVRDLVEQRLGHRPSGPVRLLTNLRYWGYLINPISLYYCFDETGAEVDAVVAEVTNTPWGERHCYVLPGPPAHQRTWRHDSAKELHVSPFFPMDMQYLWRLTSPGDRLSVHIENRRAGEPQFDATLLLRRHPLSTATLAACLLRHPWMTGKVAAGIYWQALRLRLRGAQFHPHPRSLQNNRDSLDRAREPDGVTRQTLSGQPLPAAEAPRFVPDAR